MICNMLSSARLKRLAAAFFSAALLCLLCACGGADPAAEADAAPMVYSRNPDIPCVEYIYTLREPYFAREPYANLSKTHCPLNRDFAFSAEVIRSYAVYEELLERLGAYSAYAEDVEIRDFPQTAYRTADGERHEIDEAFFAEHNLLMIDLLESGAQQIYPRLDKLVFSDGRAALELQYDYINGGAADNYGVLYFIPVPEDCVLADVTRVFVPKWYSDRS